VTTLKQFSERLKTLPTELGHRVAAAAADKITELGRETFDGSRDPYGTPWAPGADGDAVDLNESGRLKSHLSYKPVGAKLRSELGVPYAKYQIGKRPVYPKGALPPAYRDALNDVAKEETRKLLEGS
jgi:hypothetical protein